MPLRAAFSMQPTALLAATSVKEHTGRRHELYNKGTAMKGTAIVWADLSQF